MGDFVTTMKDLLNRSAKSIVRMFNTAVSETKYKANEISMGNKRRELVNELGKKVLELSGSGLILPQEAVEIVEQIHKLDADLNVLRSDHAAQKAANAEQHAMEKAARASEKAAAKAASAIEKSTANVEVETPAVEVSVAPETDAPVAPTLELDVEDAVQEEYKPDVPTLDV